MSRSELDTKIREKLKGRGKEGTPSYKPPYREIAVVADAIAIAPTGPSMSKIVVAEAAKKLVSTADPMLMRLVDRLVTANKHELHKASGGQMNIDLKTGIISTPIGVITKDGISQARDILTKMQPFVLQNDFDAKPFIQNINDYLMLVPQQVGHSRGWHKHFLTDVSSMQRQSTLLDQLEASADLAAARMVAAAAAGTASASVADVVPNLFTAKITKLEDPVIIARIIKMFDEHKNASHESAKLKPIAFYEVELPEAKAAYEKDGAKMDNQWLLWHGTRMFNVLSILKSGLIIPKSGGSYQITGRMFGNGIYFSTQSTKSLNYSYGFWDGKSRDNNCFMFLADVAMGKYHVPGGGYGLQQIPAGYDSCYAKAGTGGVRNDECIVYRLSQANLRYLIEFDSN